MNLKEAYPLLIQLKGIKQPNGPIVYVNHVWDEDVLSPVFQEELLNAISRMDGMCTRQWHNLFSRVFITENIYGNCVWANLNRFQLGANDWEEVK